MKSILQTNPIINQSKEVKILESSESNKHPTIKKDPTKKSTETNKPLQSEFTLLTPHPSTKIIPMYTPQHRNDINAHYTYRHNIHHHQKKNQINPQFADSTRKVGNLIPK